MADFSQAASFTSVRRAVCYLRRSREDEEAERRGEDTLAGQRDMLVHGVLARCPFPFDVAAEVASGDSIRDRPVFAALLLQLGSVYQAIVCKDLSRLGRGSYGDMGLVYDILCDRRILVITHDSVYDPARFSDLRMIRFSLFFNREEYEMTVWRLMEGKKEGARKGRWVAGAVPYGFVYDPQTGGLSPHPQRAQVVEQVFRLYADERLGYRTIAAKLHDLGVPAPRGGEVWHPEVVRRLLRNPAYSGVLAFRRTRRLASDRGVRVRPESEHIVVPAAFAPLVSAALWQRAANRRREQSPVASLSRAAAPEPARSRAELAGLVWCGACGGRMVRQAATRRYQRQDGGESTYSRSFLYCATCHYAVKYRACEQQLERVLEQLTLPAAARLAERLARRLAIAVPPASANPSAALRSLAVWQKRLERARELLLDGTLTAVDYRAVKERYEEHRRRWAAPLPEPQAAAVDAAPLPEPQAAAVDAAPLRTVADVYRQLHSRHRRNQLLRLVIQAVRVQRLERGKGPGQPARFDLDVTLHPTPTSPDA